MQEYANSLRASRAISKVRGGLPAPGFFDCARSRVDFSSWEIAAFG